MTKEGCPWLWVFTKMQFFRNQLILGKIHQRFDKIQMRQKGASCTNSHYKKMANLGDNGKFWKWHVDSCRFLGKWHFFVKIANLATIHLRFAKIQMRWPMRHVDRWRFLQKWQIWWKWRIWEGVINEWLAKMAKLGRIHERFEQNSKEIIKKATLTINKHF